MCILCVLQRASRRARNMLPWLVLALIVLWAVSQLLPPPFRLEMTTARLACVLFLVGYFSWYEVLLPQLSVWRARRSARLRERRWSEAVELQKLRKAATRRCRNCLTPYRDQNPGGGRFMCSYCGHISKRPVLDIPGPPGSAGIISDILGRNGWICSQDWQSDGNGNWRYWLTSGDDHCLTEKSYSDAAVFTCKLLSSFFLCVRWLGRWIFRLGSSREDGSLDADGQGLSSKGENGENYQETRSEKARRKAEEKRRARLEREMLEEEERKQREEVARLIEEQRKLRDEKLETKKEQFRGSCAERIRDTKKDLEKKRQERRKDRDKGSSKSNSDGEEMEKKSVVEIDKKRDLEKKYDNERRDSHKAGLESSKTYASETTTQGAKGVVSKSRYFDRVKGSFLSSSRGFSGANFFGKASQNAAVTATKPNKPITGSVEQTNNVNRKEAFSAGHLSGRQTSSGDDSTAVTSHQPNAITSPPATNVWKKSWHQLFTCSSAVGTSFDKNATVSNMNGETTQMNAQRASPSYAIGHQLQFGQPFSLNAYPQVNDSVANISNFSTAANSSHPFVGAPSHNTILDEAELFEDPCYVPDPIALIGPVSESLDNFPMDIGTGFISNSKLESSVVFRRSYISADVSKPSPIESPLSRLRLSEQKDVTPGQFPGTVKARDSYASSHGGSAATSHEPGIWQMWGTPLAQESLSIIGASANRVLPIGKNKADHEDIVHSLVHEHTIEHISEANLAHFGILPAPNKSVGSLQNDDSHAPLMNVLNETNPWLENSVLKPLFNDVENQFPPLKLREDITPANATYQNLDRLEAGHDFELPSPDCWSKSDWAMPGTSEYGNAPASKLHIGGLFPTESDIQPVWTFK